MDALSCDTIEGIKRMRITMSDRPRAVNGRTKVLIGPDNESTWITRAADNRRPL